MASRGAPQQSVTSLARYASVTEPNVDLFNGSRSKDYCNSFWGNGDAGPNIMFARMRGASKTTDELRNFWNERRIIEEEYATRLAKLAKASIGGDEIGGLRSSLNTFCMETEEQAKNHLELANQIRLVLEGPTAQFHQKQINHRQTIQAPLERKFKEKQVHESYVKKSREKYEADCLRINSYTQQLSYMQGSDLIKVQQQLQRTKQTMIGNERDFTRFTKELKDMIQIWEKEWKDFCDLCQDLEEERLAFMKDILWAYANEISTVCVSDDQSCEAIRMVLDQFEPEKDVENFVTEYGTGNTIVYPAEIPPSSGGQEAQVPASPLLKISEHLRVSRRPAPVYTQDRDENDQRQQSVDGSHYPQAVSSTPAHPNGDATSGYDATSTNTNGTSMYTSRTNASPPATSPPNIPPPPIPEPFTIQSNSTNTSTSTARPQREQRESMPLPPRPDGWFTQQPAQQERPQTPPPPLPQ